MDIRVASDPAGAAAEYIADRLRRAIDDRGSATLAVSGGSTAPPLFAAMSRSGRPTADDGGILWGRVAVWQVDERVAPDGDPDRNAGQLAGLPAEAHLMPVNEADPAAAAQSYAASLPPRFDVVHLGLGDDGHTASWAPSPHPDAERALVTTDPVFVIGAFNGRSRMTLGVDVVNAADERVVLVVGSTKADAVARWVGAVARRGGGPGWVDVTLPIAAVQAERTVLFLDAPAAGGLDDTAFVAIGP